MVEGDEEVVVDCAMVAANTPKVVFCHLVKILDGLPSSDTRYLGVLADDSRLGGRLVAKHDRSLPGVAQDNAEDPVAIHLC